MRTHTLLSIGLFVAAAACMRSSAPVLTEAISARDIAGRLELPLLKGEFPKEIAWDAAGYGGAMRIRYGIDIPSQLFIEGLLHSHRPDYGAFVAIEADTGRVLSMVSYVNRPELREGLGNLALRSTFPAASIFKIVTAAAALDQKKVTADTQIEFTGSNHTLYRRNVIRNEPTRWSRQMSIAEAFAKSVNTVFAKVGLFFLGPNDLLRYAERFQFNRRILSDFPATGGSFQVPDYSRWVIAEAASGFNQYILLSPLHGALIASAVVNDGIMMQPYLVDGLTDGSGASVYSATRQVLGNPIGPDAAEQLREMMQLTVENGTSRKTFRKFRRSLAKLELEVGGKTGSLTGKDPVGKYDWFVGFGALGERRIAVAALTINVDLWRVKSSYLAGRFIEHYFKGQAATRSIATRQNDSAKAKNLPIR